MKLKRSTRKIFVLFSLMFVFSCRTTKIDESSGKYLFTGTEYKYLDNKSNPYADELESYVKPKPNKEILLFFPLPLWFYNFSDSRFDVVYKEYYRADSKLRTQSLLDSLYAQNNLSNYIGKSRWLDRFFFKNGEAPVVTDSLTGNLSAKNLQQYFVNRGWRKSIVTDTVLAKGKKAKVRYNIRLKEPSIVKELTYDINDNFIERLYHNFANTSYLKKGARLDVYEIQNDISLFEERLKNIGYYQFNELKDEMIYEVDTLNTQRSDSLYKKEKLILDINNVLVNVKIKKSSYADLGIKDTIDARQDSIRRNKFHRFKYDKISIVLTKDAKDAATYNGIKPGEGVEMEGYNVVNRNENYSNKVLTNLMGIYKWNEEEKQEQRKKQEELMAKLRGLEQKIGKEKARGKMMDKWYKWFRKYREGYYSLNDEVETRRNIYKINNFNIIGFNSRKLSDSTLATEIVLSPMPKYSYELGFDVFSSKIASYGITPNVTFTVKTYLEEEKILI